MARLKDQLAFILEVHGDFTSNIRLHLSQAPFGSVGCAHKHARFKDRTQIILHGKANLMNDHSPHSPQTLAELISSRLCHDLVNPLGAIGNGVELIEMTGSARGPEMELIRDAVRDAQARLRFMRIAFGGAGPTQILSAREAKATAQAPWLGARLKINWTADEDFPRLQVKLAFLMLLCAETALPMGGELLVSPQPSGHLRIEASAPRVIEDAALWSVLHFGMLAAARPLRPSEAQFAALHASTTQHNLALNYVLRDDGLSLSIA
jgi:histidine phosphotransferase ChpT